jgi:hypothetical protein
MYNATEQFVELNKANVAQATKLAAITFDNAEKLLQLNLTAAKTALAQGLQNAQAAASVKDVQELVAVHCFAPPVAHLIVRVQDHVSREIVF